MKKIMILAAAIAIVAGCTAEEKLIHNEKTITKEFKAEFASVTKTSIDEDLNVDWKAGDVIRYYSAASGSVKEFTVPSDGHTTLIQTEIGEEDSFVIAAYGADGITDNTGKVCTLSGAVNAEQSGTFADAHVSVAKTYDVNSGTLAFSNLTSMIQFSLTRTDVCYITFTATDSTKIHADGQLKVAFSGTTSSVSFPDGEGGCTIKVNTNGAGTFYIATLPCSIAGFEMKFFDAKGSALGQVSSANTLEIEKNQIVNLGELDSRIAPIEPTDLSAGGTANCYIVPAQDVYKFKATVKGGSTEALDGTPYKASVLWESFGTDETPTVGDVVSNAKYKDGYISFQSGRNGNAVIAVKDIDDEILWSWHIWVCEGFDPVATQQVYNNNAGIMMDRNLGATSATKGDVYALGLLYQWGRKDPFLSFDNISDTESQAASTISWPAAVENDGNTGSIEYTLNNPTTFVEWGITGDWYYAGGSYITDNERWRPSNKEKGLYDPCPYGWRVPDGGETGLWAQAFGSSSYFVDGPWQSSHYGMDFGTGNGLSKDKQLGTANVIWYPASGNKTGNSTLQFAGRLSHFWTASPVGIFASILEIDKGEANVNPAAQSERAYALSVRCQRDLATSPSKTYTIELPSSGTKTTISSDSQISFDDNQPIFLSDNTMSDTPALSKISDTKGSVSTKKMTGEEVIAGIPYTSFSLSSNVICTIPTSQSGTFNDAYICSGKANSENIISLQSLVAVVKLTFDKQIDSLVFASNDGTAFAGTGTVDYTSEPAFNLQEGYSSVTLRPTESGTEYYVAVAPVTFSSGFSVSAYKNGIVTKKTAASARTMQKGTLISFPQINLETAESLDENGTANCYIVNKAGTFSFNGTVKGGSTESVGTPVSAEVLWESFGTDETPSVGDIVKDVKYTDGRVFFSTPATSGV